MAGRVQFEVDADEGPAVRAFLRLVDAQKKTEDGMKGVGRAAGNAGKETEKSFGSKASNDLAQYATRFLSISAAIGVMTAALHKANAEAAKAAELAKSSAAGLGALSQLAATAADPNAEMKRLMGLVRDVQLAGKTVDANKAADLVGSLEAAQGLMPERKFFAELYGSLDPAAMAKAAGKVRQVFGVKEAGTGRQLVSKALAAAKEGIGVEDILRETITAAPLFAELGLSDEEAMAAISLVAERTREPGIAGTQVQAVLSKLMKEGVAAKGTPFAKMLKDVKSKQMTSEGLLEYFGERGIRGYLALSGEGDYEKRLAEVRGGNVRDYSQAAIEARRSIPELAAVEEANKGEVDRYLSDIQVGVKQNLTEAVIDREMAKSRLRGEDFLDRIMREGAMRLRRFFGGEPEEVKRAESLYFEPIVKLGEWDSSLRRKVLQGVRSFQSRVGEKVEKGRQWDSSMLEKGAGIIEEGYQFGKEMIGFASDRVADGLDKINAELSRRNQANMRGEY